jgi:glycosyltransferase involved in cell wall biosynthesis
MRASHLVLGLLPKRLLSDRRLAASFHQLPSQDSSGIQGKFEDILVKRGVKSAGLITAPSARAVAELIERGFGTEANVRVEHNIIATSDKPAVPPREGRLERLNLVFAGRLSQQKGLDRIPELLAGVSTPIHLRCLGDGEQRSAVERSLADVRSPHRVELLPHTDDVESFFDWSDAVFLPSRWELNPLVIWEARARGRGAIASNIDVFEDLAGSGPVWMFRDQSTFSSVVERLAHDESERRRAFTSAIESVEQLSTRSSIVDYLEV